MLAVAGALTISIREELMNTDTVLLPMEMAVALTRPTLPDAVNETLNDGALHQGRSVTATTDVTETDSSKALSSASCYGVPAQWGGSQLSCRATTHS
jgi:hypothetical protein